MTAFTPFTFQNTIENNGNAIKLRLFQAQSFEVVEKEAREGVRQEDVTMRMKSPIKRSRDNLYLIDCAVTIISSDVTAKDPKCSPQCVIEHCIFPTVQKLFAAGGKYQGYNVVYQGDGAGPHVEAAFLEFICTSCEREYWARQPHAAQMPHINVLNLAVFPCISQRHYSVAC